MKTIKEYLYYFVKVNSERSHRLYYRDYYKNYLNEFEQCKNKKSKKIIKMEMKILQKYWNVYPIHYFRYYFYRAECTLDIEEMKNYIPDYFAYYLLFPKSFKDRNILCEDKKVAHIFNTGLNIPQPKSLLFIDNKKLLSPNLESINEFDFNKIISESTANKIFVKPTFGIGGKGIEVFNKDKINNLFFNDNLKVALNWDYISRIIQNDYVIQEGVNQHKIMDNIYPYSVNTFRIVTELKNSNVTILFALLRMGCGGMQIDNASSGGIYIKIDSKTGELGKIAIADNRKEYTHHPDTLFKFENYKIPVWNDIIEFAKEIANKYAPIKYIGWDIAYSTNGPILIEGNNGPGIEIIQDHFGGIRKDFNINDPKAYWFSNKYGLKDL